MKTETLPPSKLPTDDLLETSNGKKIIKETFIPYLKLDRCTVLNETNAQAKEDGTTVTSNESIERKISELEDEVFTGKYELVASIKIYYTTLDLV